MDLFHIGDSVIVRSTDSVGIKYNNALGVIVHVQKETHYWCWVEFQRGNRAWFRMDELKQCIYQVNFEQYRNTA